MTDKVTKLREVSAASRSSRAQEVRDRLQTAVRVSLDTLGDDICGYALVAWDSNGGLRSSLGVSDDGPISEALAPTLVADALNRHVAVALANPDAVDEAG